MAIGGKGFRTRTRGVSDVEAAVEASAREIANHGLLAGKAVILRSENRLYREVIRDRPARGVRPPTGAGR